MAGHKSRSDRAVTETPSCLAGKGQIPGRDQEEGLQEQARYSGNQNNHSDKKGTKKSSILLQLGHTLKKKWHSTKAAGSKSPLVFFKKKLPIFSTKEKSFQIQPTVCHQTDESKHSHTSIVWVLATPSLTDRRHSNSLMMLTLILISYQRFMQTTVKSNVFL